MDFHIELALKKRRIILPVASFSKTIVRNLIEMGRPLRVKMTESWLTIQMGLTLI